MKPNEFITSDTHWGHSNIIRYNNRPFRDVDEMDEELILRWNAKVPKNAVVYHLGDFAFASPKKLYTILQRLHGRIRFFPGNHDKWLLMSPENGLGIKEKYQNIADRFEWVRPFGFHESSTNDGTLVVMCHYAMQVWNKHHYGAWMLHGHSHGSLPPGNRARMDVGIDCHPNYEPFSFEEIYERLHGVENETCDHHVAMPR